MQWAKQAFFPQSYETSDEKKQNEEGAMNDIKNHTETDKWIQKNIYSFKGKDIRWQDNNLSINTCKVSLERQ